MLGSGEASEGFNGLVGRTVLTETNGILGGNPDDLVTGESGEKNGTGGKRRSSVVNNQSSVTPKFISVRLCTKDSSRAIDRRGFKRSNVQTRPRISPLCSGSEIVE